MLRLPLPLPKWLPEVVTYVLVAAILGTSGYTIQLVQGRVDLSRKTAVANVEQLSRYTSGATAYRSLRRAISQAKDLGIDTSAEEAQATTILANLNGNDIDAATAAALDQTLLLSSRIDAALASAAAAAEEAKRYGTLAITVTNGSGAGLSAKADSDPVTGTADDQGKAELKLLVGTYTLTVTKSGYQTATVSGISITSLATANQSVTLTATVVAPKPKATATPKPTTTPAPSSSTAHSSYRRTTVSSSRGTYTADIMEFDLGPGKIKVITETAGDDDCSNNCPTLSVKGYADRFNGAVAAINGTYFCPVDYASCSGEVNSFFWKIRNPRANRMVNGTNGLGENDGFLTFDSTGNATYYSKWSSAPGVYAGINHKPTVVSGGHYSVDENTLDDKQRTGKITRAAIGLAGQHLTVVSIQSATIMDLGAVMEALGVTTALNLDGGGSSGMWYNGAYRRGPGRSVPNAIVFIEQ